MAGFSDEQCANAKKIWEIANNAELINTIDDIVINTKKEQQDLLAVERWEKDPHFFKDIKISVTALLKMVMHARSRGTLQAVGLVHGKFSGNKLVVIDSDELPKGLSNVPGTEVGLQAQAYKYMATYNSTVKSDGYPNIFAGIYSSDPGLISLQFGNNAPFDKPYVAIVIDPVRTIATGKAYLQAFRSYPKGYKPLNQEPIDDQTIPLNKIEDFEIDGKDLLKITYFKCCRYTILYDLLWNKYWASILNPPNIQANFDSTTSQVMKQTLGSGIEGEHSSQTNNKTSRSLHQVC